LAFVSILKANCWVKSHEQVFLERNLVRLCPLREDQVLSSVGIEERLVSFQFGRVIPPELELILAFVVEGDFRAHGKGRVLSEETRAVSKLLDFEQSLRSLRLVCAVTVRVPVYVNHRSLLQVSIALDNYRHCVVLCHRYQLLLNVAINDHLLLQEIL